MFSLFRQRGTRGYDYEARYYDAEQEARDERRRKAQTEGRSDVERLADRDRFAKRLRHSWHRPSSDRSRLMRLVVIMGMVCVILFFILKGFGLLDISAWPT